MLYIGICKVAPVPVPGLKFCFLRELGPGRGRGRRPKSLSWSRYFFIIKNYTLHLDVYYCFVSRDIKPAIFFTIVTKVFTDISFHFKKQNF